VSDTIEGTARPVERRRRVLTIVVLVANGLFIVLALCLRAFWIEAFKIPSPGMSPTLVPGDHIFVKKMAYGWFEHAAPPRGDAVVFRFPERTDQAFIQRVIGLPGDRISVKGGAVYINDWKVPSCPAGRVSMPGAKGPREGELFMEYLGDQAYVVFHDATYGRLADIEQGPYEVAPGQVFMLGDNRENSYDSRLWFEGRGGGVPLADIKGRASVIWMSFAPNGIAWSRVGTSLLDPPPCPEEFSQPTCQALTRCLAQRPPASATHPPRHAPAR
jgi:signal peptidase I